MKHPLIIKKKYRQICPYTQRKGESRKSEEELA
jgi:hypothetical protein